MKLQELIQTYKDKSKSEDINDQYSSLLFALQLPSICSRLEFPKTEENTKKLYKNNGTPLDGKLYRYWIESHAVSFEDILMDNLPLDKFCNAVYSLRCQLMHQGIVTSTKSKFYFVHNGKCSMFIDGITFLPIEQFCDDIFSAANESENILCMEITLSKDMMIPNDVYEKILQSVHGIYESFWKTRDNDDNILYLIYEAIINERPYNKKKIDDFFLNNPDKLYEIWDFGYKYRIVQPDNKYFFEDYDQKNLFIQKT